MTQNGWVALILALCIVAILGVYFWDVWNDRDA